MGSDLIICELNTEQAIAGAYDLMAVLRPHLRRETFVSQIRGQQCDGYRLMGGFADETVVVLAGFRMARTLARGEHFFVDDLVTAPDQQAKGYASAMLRQLAQVAQEAQVTRIWLDSRNTALSYYEKVGFTVHTSMPCWIDADRL